MPESVPGPVDESVAEYNRLEARKKELEAEKERLEQEMRALREKAHEEASLIEESRIKLEEAFAKHVEEVDRVEKLLDETTKMSEAILSRITSGEKTMTGEELKEQYRALAQVVRQKKRLSERRLALEQELSRFIEEEIRCYTMSHGSSEESQPAVSVQAEPHPEQGGSSVYPEATQTPDDARIESTEEVPSEVYERLQASAAVYAQRYFGKLAREKERYILDKFLSLWRKMTPEQREEYTHPVYVPSKVTAEDVWEQGKLLYTSEGLDQPAMIQIARKDEEAMDNTEAVIFVARSPETMSMEDWEKKTRLEEVLSPREFLSHASLFIDTDIYLPHYRKEVSEEVPYLKTVKTYSKRSSEKYNDCSGYIWVKSFDVTKYEPERKITAYKVIRDQEA